MRKGWVITIFAGQKHRLGLFMRTGGAAGATSEDDLPDTAYNIT